MTAIMFAYALVCYLAWVRFWTAAPGTFSGADLCINCDEQLSNDERYRSKNGVCPYCGFRGSNAISIVETYPRLFKWGPRQYLPWKNRKITWTEDPETAKGRR